VIDEFETVLFGDLVLQALDFVAGEFDDVARFDTDHVVVVLAIIEFEDRVPALEIVACDQARRLELREHAIDRRKPDFLTRVQQILVDILGTQMTIRGALEDLKDLQSR
jgi:hypothetical protein